MLRFTKVLILLAAAHVRASFCELRMDFLGGAVRGMDGVSGRRIPTYQHALCSSISFSSVADLRYVSRVCVGMVV